MGKNKYYLLLALCIGIVVAAFFTLTTENTPSYSNVQMDTGQKTTPGQLENAAPHAASVSKNTNTTTAIAADKNPNSQENTYDDELFKKKLLIFNYSRSGNFLDTEKRLEEAFNDGTLNINEYYGELAHMLSITVENPLEIVQKIMASGNNYGYTVMLGSLSSNPYLAENITPGEKKKIYDLLNANKPEIEGYINMLGFSDVFRYEEWLDSLLNFSENKAAFSKTLSNIIMKRMDDPREAIAIKYFFAHTDMFRFIDEEARYKYLFDVHNYVSSYPSNKVAKTIAEEKVEKLGNEFIDPF